MELEAIKNDLFQIRDEITFQVSGIQFYLFGSVLESNKFNDVDVLIVYKYYADLILIKKKFAFLEEFYPIHLTCLTHSEEKELDFIGRQKAFRVFSV